MFSCRIAATASGLQCLKRQAQLYSRLLATMPIGSDEVCQKHGIAEEFVNRNPRNLEMIGLAYKRRGWRFQAPRKDFYHKLCFERGKHVSAKLVHSSGDVIITASSTEDAIKRYLTKTGDVTAAACVGQVIAMRCLQSGIECVMFDSESVSGEQAEKFKQAAREAGLELEEPDENPYGPDHIGTDYSEQSQP